MGASFIGGATAALQVREALEVSRHVAADLDAQLKQAEAASQEVGACFIMGDRISGLAVGPSLYGLR